MFRTLLAALLAAAVLPAAASAAVFSRDWKTPGDGLLTYDDVNKREWLDLSQSILSSQFPGDDLTPQATRENRYQFVVSQTGPNGQFSGFVVAKARDVAALAQSAGIDTSVLGSSNSVAGLALAQLLGFTVVSPHGDGIAVGLLDEPPSDRYPFPLIRPASEISRFGLAVAEGHFQYQTPPGVMLYRNVPEPGALSLMLLMLADLVRAQRCRLRKDA